MADLQSKTILDDVVRFLPVINIAFVGFMYYIRVELGKMIEDKIEKERGWRIEDDKELKKCLEDISKKLNIVCQKTGELEKICNERHRRK